MRRRIKKTASTYMWTFVCLLFLNQLFFFGTCLNLTCLIAATPHVLVFTVILGTWISKQSNSKESEASSRPAKSRSDDTRDQILELLTKSSREAPPNIDAIPTKNLHVLTNSEHYDYLIESLKQVKEQLVIQSGWLSSFVIDNIFLRLLETKLKQNVVVYIGYGWQDWQGQHKTTDASDIALKSLTKLMKKYPKQLIMAEYPTHEKLLVVDEKIVIFGSANWLSNRKYKNSERSVIIENKQLAQREAKRVRALITDN